MKSVTGAGVLRVQDINNGALGEVNFTFSDGTKMNGAHTVSLSTELSYDKNEIPVLGIVNKGHKKLSTNGTGSGTFYDVDSTFRRYAQLYQNEMKDEYFDMQVVQYDPTSASGRQAITYHDCNIDNIVLSQLDINSTELTVDMAFTFESYTIDSEYDQLDALWG